MTLVQELQALFAACGVPNADTITAIRCDDSTHLQLVVETVDRHEELSPGQDDLTRTATSLPARMRPTWGDDESTPIWDALVRDHVLA